MPKIESGIAETFRLMAEGAAPSDSRNTTREKKLLQEVNADVDDMIEYRKPAVQIADEAIQGYMAMAIGSKEGRSMFFPPTLHAIVYSRMSLEAASMPKVIYKHRLSQSEPMMKFLNAAKANAETGDNNLRPDSQFLWFQQNFDKLLFGVGFRLLTYLLQTRIIHVKDRNGKWVEKMVVVHDDIWDEKLSFFHTGVSRDAMPGLFGATSCYTDKFYRREQFFEHFNTGLYRNIDLVDEKIKGPFIRVRYYWNLPKDAYIVQAMDKDKEESVGESSILIREDYILDQGPEGREQKFLPITSIHEDFNFDATTPSLPNFTQDGRQYTEAVSMSRNQTFWTKGNGQLVKGIVSLKRALWRASHDNVKASSVHFLMSQSAGVLNQLRKAQPLYGIIPIKTSGEAFDTRSLLENNSFFNKFFEYDTAVDNLAAFALGNDWKTAAHENINEKATVAAIRENVKRVRVMQNQRMNECGPYKRHYRILLNLIQQYYPEKTEVELLGNPVPEGTPEEDIIRDRDGHPVKIRREKMIKVDEPIVIDEKGKPKADMEGDYLVPARKEFIITKEEPEIYVEPGSTFAEMKAIDRGLNLELLNTLQFYAGLVYPDDKGVPQPLIPKEGMKYILEQTAKAWDQDPDKLLGKEEDEEDIEIPMPFSGMNEMMAAPPGNLPQQAIPQSGAPPPSMMAGQNALAQSLIPR